MLHKFQELNKKVDNLHISMEVESFAAQEVLLSNSLELVRCYLSKILVRSLPFYMENLLLQEHQLAFLIPLDQCELVVKGRSFGSGIECLACNLA